MAADRDQIARRAGRSLANGQGSIRASSCCGWRAISTAASFLYRLGGEGLQVRDPVCMSRSLCLPSCSCSSSIAIPEDLQRRRGNRTQRFAARADRMVPAPAGKFLQIGQVAETRRADVPSMSATAGQCRRRQWGGHSTARLLARRTSIAGFVDQRARLSRFWGPDEPVAIINRRRRTIGAEAARFFQNRKGRSWSASTRHALYVLRTRRQHRWSWQQLKQELPFYNSCRDRLSATLMRSRTFFARYGPQCFDRRPRRAQPVARLGGA